MCVPHVTRYNFNANQNFSGKSNIKHKIQNEIHNTSLTNKEKLNEVLSSLKQAMKIK